MTVPDVDAAPSGSVGSTRPVVAATGYSYGGASSAPTPARTLIARDRPPRPSGAGTEALMSGFETLSDGSTRLFVDLRNAVFFDTRPGKGTITYVLKGAHVDRRNHENPLVTIHFNTPVTSARLSSHGRDLWLVVDLRADVQPTSTMETGKDGLATLRIAFPKGSYLPAPARAPRESSPVDAIAASSPAGP